MSLKINMDFIQKDGAYIVNTVNRFYGENWKTTTVKKTVKYCNFIYQSKVIFFLERNILLYC